MTLVEVLSVSGPESGSGAGGAGRSRGIADPQEEQGRNAPKTGDRRRATLGERRPRRSASRWAPVRRGCGLVQGVGRSEVDLVQSVHLVEALRPPSSSRGAKRPPRSVPRRRARRVSHSRSTGGPARLRSRNGVASPRRMASASWIESSIVTDQVLLGERAELSKFFVIKLVGILTSSSSARGLRIMAASLQVVDRRARSTLAAPRWRLTVAVETSRVAPISA